MQWCLIIFKLAIKRITVSYERLAQKNDVVLSFNFNIKEKFMKEYIKKISEKPSFERDGFDGYIANNES